MKILKKPDFIIFDTENHFKRLNKMSLLYKPKEEQTIEVSIVQGKEKISIEFSSDCGKFGTDEMLAGWILTPERLLQILSEREDIKEDEL